MAKNGQDKSDGLTAKQVKAIESLLTEPTIQKAAETTGVSYTQLRRWLAETGFADAYRRARSVLFESTLAGLQAVVSDAVKTLHKIMGDESNAASVRVNAAGKLLEAGFKSRDMLDVEQRLAELEARFAAMPDNQKER